MNSFDIDGVIFIEEGLYGVYPGPGDVIITGRSVEEFAATRRQLDKAGVYNQIFFNPIRFEHKSRETSGAHKARTLLMLYRSGYNINVHFEDDEVQAKIIEEALKGLTPTTVVRLVHDLTNKENVWHNPKSL
jgi:hypothetical protein